MCFHEILPFFKKMNCGGNGGRDQDGKTPEQKHREHVEAMDKLRRREEV